jgi:hypothetical protein
METQKARRDAEAAIEHELRGLKEFCRTYWDLVREPRPRLRLNLSAPAMIYKVLSDPELSFLARMEWFRERAYGIRPVADRVGTQIIWYDFDQAWAVALRRMSNYRLRQRGYQVKPL